jgi:hypothetical protein
LDRASRSTALAGIPAAPPPGNPATRAPALDDLQLDLTVGESPPTRPAHARVPRQDSQPETAGPSIQELRTLIQELRTLIQAVSGLMEEAERRVPESIQAAVVTALAEITSTLRVERSATEASLAETARSAGAVVQLMESVMDSAVEVSERVTKEYREANQASLTRLDQLLQRVEEVLGGIAARTEAELKNSATLAERLLSEAERLGRRLGWRPWIMAAGVALGTILLLTLLRPGWTMSASQRTALRVGEAVIYTYSNATPAERAEMRRVNRWREPGRSETTEPPPLPEAR